MAKVKASERYIPVLIFVTLSALIALQAVWLMDAYHYKKQELNGKTRDAVLATTQRLQTEEDTKLVLNNMDSLLAGINEIPDIEKEARVITSRIKNQVSIQSSAEGGLTRQELSIINDSGNTTTVLSVHGGKTQKVVLRSGSTKVQNPKKKAKKLEKLFLKIALNATDAKKSIEARIDSQKVRLTLNEELKNRGIDLIPEFSVSYFPRDTIAKKAGSHVLCSTPGITTILPPVISMPIFPDDLLGGDFMIRVGYISTKNFLFRQMTGLLALSLAITILVGFVMIYIFKHLLSQEKLHRLKNDFVNNMTHELKTPIATISLAVDAINKSWVRHDDERFAEYTRILREENQKLNSHVERVLQVAQLDKGELSLHKTNVRLVELLQACIKAHALQIEKLGATVNCNFPETPVEVNADVLHLGNVFSNLLDNALKYCKGHCVVDILMEHKEKLVTVHFRDNGIGIDAEALKKVFDKFYRVQGGNVHDVKGFGLGLSYARSVIEAHGATIEVKSVIGEGSEFIVKLKTT